MYECPADMKLSWSSPSLYQSVFWQRFAYLYL